MIRIRKPLLILSAPARPRPRVPSAESGGTAVDQGGRGRHRHCGFLARPIPLHGGACVGGRRGLHRCACIVQNESGVTRIFSPFFSFSTCTQWLAPVQPSSLAIGWYGQPVPCLGSVTDADARAAVCTHQGPTQLAQATPAHGLTRPRAQRRRPLCTAVRASDPWVDAPHLIPLPLETVLYDSRHCRPRQALPPPLLAAPHPAAGTAPRPGNPPAAHREKKHMKITHCELSRAAPPAAALHSRGPPPSWPARASPRGAGRAPTAAAACSRQRVCTDALSGFSARVPSLDESGRP